MRKAIVLLAGLSALGACTAQPERVNATPPTVSYRVNGADTSQANVSAVQYCQRYGTGAQYQGLQGTPSGNIAVYSCSGPMPSSGSSVAPPYAYGAPGAYGAPPPTYGAPTQCADSMHEDLPGGTDYYGPPVAGCPPQR